MSQLSMDEINQLVALQFGKKQVNETDRFMEDLGAESADVANLVAAVEDRYHIEVKETEIARLVTPKDLFDLVSSRL
jgi:acyl carrier protein